VRAISDSAGPLVLVVEDEPEIAALLRDFLEADGFRVLLAADAEVAAVAARLAQTAEHDARLEAERRLLVSSIAHDLRTPLFSLRGYLDAIATGIGNPRERLDRARAKAQQIDRLVTGLFDYARADIDERPRLQTTDLAEAVIDATAAFELAVGERGVKLQVTAHSHPSVTIDRDGFERALANVLDNALRHTPRGGTVDVACGEAGDHAFVRVIDDGPGIAPDLLPRLFQLKARAAGNSRAGGAGLGLTIAARLLRNQGGTIEAANASPRGAIFTLRLPLRSA
jgi:signal transduction histidine kinase